MFPDGPLELQPDNCPVEKVHIDRTSAGPRFDTPLCVWTLRFNYFRFARLQLCCRSSPWNRGVVARVLIGVSQTGRRLMARRRDAGRRLQGRNARGSRVATFLQGWPKNVEELMRRDL
ncbi:unnamed protein product [Musa hybrid cultivar]